MINLDNLCQELLVLIFSFLLKEDILNLKLARKYFYKIIINNILHHYKIELLTDHSLDYIFALK